MAVTVQKRADLVKKFGTNAKDTGRTEVQVALLTERINTLAPHFAKNKKDHSGNRGLLKMIGQRKSLLKYLARTEEVRYQKLIKELELRK
jgi:small subunit ribosomal protein S15